VRCRPAPLSGFGPEELGLESSPNSFALGAKRLNYFPILNILVPHVGQTPSVAGLPFFMVTDLAFFISRLLLHLTQ
jgi:hypothetical protein